MADAEGIYFDETINGRLRGVSRMESLDIILEKASREYTQEEKNNLPQGRMKVMFVCWKDVSDDLSQEVKRHWKYYVSEGISLRLDQAVKIRKRF